MGYAISSKGQVTIPIDVRNRLGVQPGDEIEYVNEAGKTVVRPVRKQENPFTKWIGIANPTGKPFPEGTAVAWVRSLRDEEDDSAE